MKNSVFQQFFMHISYWNEILFSTLYLNLWLYDVGFLWIGGSVHELGMIIFRISLHYFTLRTIIFPAKDALLPCRTMNLIFQKAFLRWVMEVWGCRFDHFGYLNITVIVFDDVCYLDVQPLLLLYLLICNIFKDLFSSDVPAEHVMKKTKIVLDWLKLSLKNCAFLGLLF